MLRPLAPFLTEAKIETTKKSSAQMTRRVIVSYFAWSLGRIRAPSGNVQHPCYWTDFMGHFTALMVLNGEVRGRRPCFWENQRDGLFGAAAWKLFSRRVTLVRTNVAATLLINSLGIAVPPLEIRRLFKELRD